MTASSTTCKRDFRHTHGTHKVSMRARRARAVPAAAEQLQQDPAHAPQRGGRQRLQQQQRAQRVRPLGAAALAGPRPPAASAPLVKHDIHNRMGIGRGVRQGCGWTIRQRVPAPCRSSSMMAVVIVLHWSHLPY